jgi:hypothetical protein
MRRSEQSISSRTPSWFENRQAMSSVDRTRHSAGAFRLRTCRWPVRQLAQMSTSLAIPDSPLGSVLFDRGSRSAYCSRTFRPTVSRAIRGC